MAERSRPTVKELMVERILSGSEPGKRRDPYNLRVVIASGGMAGAVTGGEVTALSALKALLAIDSVGANSSGSAAAFYFVSGNPAEGTSIYCENLVKREFINSHRILGPKPIMDVQFLINIMREQKSLHAEKIVESRQNLHTYVASAKNVNTLDFDRFKNPDEVFDVLSWTIRLPVIAGMPVRVGQDYYMDGASYIGAVPFFQAVQDGCTHVMVLMARPMDNPKEAGHLFEFIIKARLGVEFPEAARQFGNRQKVLKQNLKMMKDIQDGISHNVELMVIQPSMRISAMETRKNVLVEGAKQGYEAVRQAFRGSGVIFDRSVRIID